MNQMNIYQEEIKTQSQNTAHICRDTAKCMYQEMKMVYFKLEMIVFDGSFGSYVLRQLIADHINYNKNLYIDNIEGDFIKYVEKIR